MAFYIALTGLGVIAFIVGAVTDKYIKKRGNIGTTIAFIAVMSAMFLLTALRADNIGNDTAEYIKIFYTIKKDGIRYALTGRYEPGYVLLNYIIAVVFGSHRALIIIAALIPYAVFTFFFLRTSKNLPITTVLFFAVLFSFGIGATRQFISVSFVALTYYFIIKERNLQALLFLFIAVSFHYTAVAAAALFVFPYISKGDRRALTLVSATILVLISGALPIVISAIFPDYSHYFDGAYAGTGAIAVSLSLVRSAAFYTVYRLSSQSVSPYIRGAYTERVNNLDFYVTLSPALISVASYSLNLFERVANYFATPVMCILPNSLIRFTSRTRCILSVFIVVCCIAYFFAVLIFRPEWNRIAPYRFFSV